MPTPTNLKNVIYLSNSDYNTLVSTGTVTIDGITLTYSDDNVYVTPDTIATTTEDGLMSAADKVKLNSLSALPTVVNDRYLHTNSSTGNLEWSSLSIPTNSVTTDGGTSSSPQIITGYKEFDAPITSRYYDGTNHGGCIVFTGYSGISTAKTTIDATLGSGSSNNLIHLPDASGTLAIDDNVVHKTGNETIEGNKEFTTRITVTTAYINTLVNQNSTSGYGIAIPNSSSWSSPRTMATTADLPQILDYRS